MTDDLDLASGLIVDFDPALALAHVDVQYGPIQYTIEADEWRIGVGKPRDGLEGLCQITFCIFE